jgi:hypothetical protein
VSAASQSLAAKPMVAVESVFFCPSPLGMALCSAS